MNRLILLLLGLAITAGVSAAPRTVRVAFREDSGYAFRTPDGVRDGFNVALMNRIATCLDLDIEWVDVKWGEVAAKLEEGAFDVVPDPANVDPLRSLMNIGHVPIGYWRMCLYALHGSVLDALDYRVLEGTVIGVPKGHPANATLKRNLAECRVKCELRDYPDVVSLQRALFTGEIGAVYTEPMEALRYEKLLLVMPPVPMYFGTARGQEKLLDSIDAVLAGLRDNEPEFLEELQARYFRNERPSLISLNPRELDWLARQRRSRKVFQVDVSPVDGYFKMLNEETGSTTGGAMLLLDEISDKVGLSFSVLKSVSHSEALERFRNGSVEIAMPYGCREGHHAEFAGRRNELRLPIPQAVCTRRFASVNLANPDVRIAVSGRDQERLLAYRNLGFTQRMLVCEDERHAFAAMAEGRADCYIDSYPVVRCLVERQIDPENYDMRISYDAKYRPYFPILVNPRADPMLVSILAKTVNTISIDRLVALADRAAAAEFGERTFRLREIVRLILPISAAALTALVLILYFSRRRARRLLHRSEVALAIAQESIDESGRAKMELKEALDRAEYAAKSKTNFLATMSHEIRTPLNAVVGYSEFLTDPAVTSEKVREYARGISLSANALLSLINDVLDISKFESGRREGLDLRAGECDLRALFDEMRTVFRLRCRNKGIGIEFSIDEMFPRLVLAEPRVRQILLNLIGNAVKFTDRGGITVLARFRKDELTLEVSDTGIGITERGRKYIFDPFAQDMDSRRGRIYSGTGLGLSIVKRLVESSGGTIEVESEVGKGSRFVIRVPGVKYIERPAVPSRSASAGEAVRRNRDIRNVVIVDDVPMNRTILKLHCQSLGLADIKSFGSGQEVIDYLVGGNDPDLILSDMWMPGMDGSQLSRQVAEKWPQVMVVAVTADTDPASKFDMSAFRAVLSKPVTGAKLKELFEKLKNEE